MKLLPLMFGLSKAVDFAGINELWEAVTTSSNVNEDDRKIMELFTLSAIGNYGCWCRFSSYHPYKGPTMDSVDGVCKQWYQNYGCMSFDYTGCDADVQYNDTMTQIIDPFNPTTDFIAQCAIRNPNDVCAATACAVDAEFVRDIFNYMADNTLNMTLSGFYGFDGSDCVARAAAASVDSSSTVAPFTVVTEPSNPGVAVTGMVPVDCCGKYPKRYSYKVNNGQRGCCVQNTYDTGLLECCSAVTGGTALIGACPGP